MLQERRLKKKEKEKGQDFDGSVLPFEGGELEERLLRVQQYLEDQVNNVGDRVLQLYHASNHDLQSNHVEDQDLLGAGEAIDDRVVHDWKAAHEQHHRSSLWALPH